MKSKKTLLVLIVLFIISFIYTKLSENINEDKNIVVPSGSLAVSFLDVGQGDSEFIEFPNGKCMLIDASEKDAGDEIVSHIRNKGYEKVDYVVATHPHSDHIGGMQQIVDSFEVGVVYMPEEVTTTKVFANLLKAIKDKKILVKKAKKGVSFSEGDAYCEFLSPVSDEYEELNNWSAVVKISFGETEFLFTGDAEELVEEQLVQTNANVKADVLKVGHHGSSTSSSMAFLRAVKPKIAVIECGKDNEYGHPHYETIQRLERIGAKIYRTDLDGTVVITSDGVEVTKL